MGESQVSEMRVCLSIVSVLREYRARKHKSGVTVALAHLNIDQLEVLVRIFSTEHSCTYWVLYEDRGIEVRINCESGWTHSLKERDIIRIGISRGSYVGSWSWDFYVKDSYRREFEEELFERSLLK